MKLQVKTVGGSKQLFEIEVEPSKTILEVKQIIGNQTEYELEGMKIVFAGKILQNEKTIEEYNVKENNFLVVVGAKKAPVVEPAAPISATPAVPAEVAPAQAVPAANRAEREQAELALRAAFGNPDRAVQYLMEGIPGEEGGEQAPPPQQQTAGFQGAAFPAMGGPQPGEGESVGDVAGLERMLQQNPQMLNQVIGELVQTNPQLAGVLQENPEAFLQMLMQSRGMGGGGGGGQPPQQQQQQQPAQQTIQIPLTAEDQAACERLQQLGFERAEVVQAYIAAEKNEELAANLLFDMGDF